MNRWLTLSMWAAVLAGTAGCRVDTHKNGDGNDNVKIATPFGGMSVKTNEAVVQNGLGLTPYPGATLIKKDTGKDNGAADVNMSFGSFHLGVKALSYHTDDTPDKVEAFYRKDMTRYGTIIKCHDHSTVGAPARTQEGLTCESDHGSVHVDSTSGTDELKAGSKQHQHIVAIERQGSGTKIGLVMLDLPTGFDASDDSKQ